ncbi:MAG: hypothetical protein R3194_10920 [Limnobacter sp.]|nr:hypothetical protein [Limnobacter sp.]
MSYNAGDDSQSIEQFTQAVANDYSVYCNALAKQPHRFTRQCAVIYGEVHTEVKIPSIRNGKGVLLTESDDPNLWLNKHQAHTGNRMIHLDSQTSEDIGWWYAPLIQRLNDMINEIDSQALRQIRSSISPTDSGHTVLEKMLEFVKQNFESARARRPDWEIPYFDYKYNKILELDSSIEQTILEQLPDRDPHMAAVAIKAIRELAPDESATLVVGARHVRPLAHALQAEFGDDLPIVVCLPKRLEQEAFMPTTF